ncbi:hypothetical protein K439DRAFT_1404572 [Ramaria rubella]|nr:hypothetical protein K439DRAFT_1404572 [Ramaria rubella]
MTLTFAHPQAQAITDPNKEIRSSRAQDYPRQIWIFLATLIGILALFRLRELLVFWRRKRRGDPSHLCQISDQSIFHGKPVNQITSVKVSLNRVPPAITNAFRIIMYRINLPIGMGSVLNGAEVTVISGYIIAIFTWEFINCELCYVNYWSNRAANIVATQFPLIIALSGKNNLISCKYFHLLYFCRISSKNALNVLHRSAARICLILVWVHFMGRLKIGLTGPLSPSHPWVRAGMSVASAYTLLVLISVKPLRVRFYEFFFFSHCVLVLMILLGAYFHIHKGIGLGPYLIPSFILWALDRALRLLRIVRNNPFLRGASREPSTSFNITAELLSPTMVRLVLKRSMSWRPGQSAFLSIPRISHIPFESHPFTIASIPRQDDVVSSSSVLGSSTEGTLRESDCGDNNELVFLIKAREGFTKRLRDTVQRQDGGGLPSSVYVDGPYGSPPDLSAFESVILISGGSGVSYTLSQLQGIVRNVRKGRSDCRYILFLWIIPYTSNLSWISRALCEVLDGVPNSLRVRFSIHVTRGDAEDGSHTSVDSFAEMLLQRREMCLKLGRPNVQELLEEEITDVRGPVSVDVAGPAGLVAIVRKVLCFDTAGPRAILRGRPDITLHVETYGIA